MIMKFIQAIVKGICYILVKIMYRVEIEGIENIPKNEGVILCGNHIHALDAPVLIVKSKKEICFMAKEELFKNPIFKMMANMYGVFPVSRGRKDTDAIRKSLEILKQNRILGIYPEGTRNGIEKGIKPKNGAVNIAIRTNTKIVPFGVKGNFKLFSKVKYTFGKPMDLSGYKGNSHDKEVIDILTNELMAKIVELRDKNEKINIAIDKE
ncbi:MAG: 1-acyl-sn-glycerol-3-phosphate acyltransferase [Clostridia bacterium]|nr:1-acyl-sn-glycerol-3-phosphate acyltransferase [Clostridia bacterium]